MHMTNSSKSKAIERLKRARAEISRLKDMRRFSPEFEKWHRNTKIAIVNTFGEKNPHVGEFTNISYIPYVPRVRLIRDGKRVPSRSDSDYHESYLDGLVSAATLLESMLEEIEEYWEDEDEVKVSPSTPKGERIDTNKVFIVHGRDEGAKHTVARFLGELELEPVILDEKADRGRTIIEKFEQEAQEIGFAVVLLTADDEGRLRGEDSELSPRARQNVVFELGYFFAYLGRSRVCALRKNDAEIPSDYQGVIYISMDDAGGWKFQLAKELQAAGYEIDADRIL